MSMPPDSPQPVEVVVVNDYQIIVDGLAAMLQPFRHLIEVRERMLIGDEVDGRPVHLALFDTYGRTGIAEPALRTLVEDPDIGQVAIFSLEFADPLMAAARRLGVTSFISKALDAASVAQAAYRAARGESVVELARVEIDLDLAGPDRHWPGREDGLTERESQALVLLAEGLTNAEIAEALYINLQTVKSRLKQAYRKIGARNRAQATSYVVETGAFRRYQPVTTALEKEHGETIDETPTRRYRGDDQRLKALG